MDKNIFVISDIWFNRPIQQDVDVLTHNENIIKTWNKYVKNEDDVYILGGLGISDLYSNVIKLNGTIHILDNYYVDDEKYFIDTLKDCVNNSINEIIKNKIIFEDKQIVVLNDYDIVLSYFPLSTWIGKKSGTICLHGLTSDTSFQDGNISCFAMKNNFRPINIINIKEKIEIFFDNSN